jgi:hypothetical protein
VRWSAVSVVSVLCFMMVVYICRWEWCYGYVCDVCGCGARHANVPFVDESK